MCKNVRGIRTGVASAVGLGLTEKEQKVLCAMMDVSGILIEMWVTWADAFIKTH